MIRALYPPVLILLLYSTAHATLLEEAKSQYEKRGEPGGIQAAVNLFQKALDADPKNYEVAWQLSRAHWYEGNHAAPGSKKPFFEKGIEAATIALQASPRGCEGHFWLGVNTALVAENSGKFTALGMVDQIKEELKTAEEIDPDCQCAGPTRVLGKVYSEIPWFKGGSDSKAIEYLEESLKRCPEDTQSRMFLVEIYEKQHNTALAIQQLQLVLKQEPDPNWLPETIENKNLAEKKLREMKGD